MERYFQQRGRVMAPSNRKQAELPASAEFINNPLGTACGFALQLNRCLMFFTPAYRLNLRLWWRRKSYRGYARVFRCRSRRFACG